MSKERNAATDRILEDVVAELVAGSADGTYTTEELAERTEERLTSLDVASLRRDHVWQRIHRRDQKQAELARSSMQRGLPGAFAPPAGEFQLGRGRRVPKAEAHDDHWIIHIKLGKDHLIAAQASLDATLQEYEAYQPILRTGATTQEAYDVLFGAPIAQAAD